MRSNLNWRKGLPACLASLTMILAACATDPATPTAEPAAAEPVAAPPAPAAPATLARVSALQPPVWVERASGGSGPEKKSLKAGDPIRPGDRLSTGAGARIHLELDDASTVKLGEQASLAVPDLSKDRGDGLLRGALHVIQGAFRYTTTALSRGRKRDLTVRIGNTVTAGIRGTDVWGKVDEEQDLICLIEGRIEVTTPGEPSVVLDQPKSVYRVPAGQRPQPVAPAGDRLDAWAPQTELNPDAPALLSWGPWNISLVSQRTLWLAERSAREFEGKGYGVEIREATVDGETWYRVVIPGLQSVRGARAWIPELEQALGLQELWVPARGS